MLVYGLNLALITLVYFYSELKKSSIKVDVKITKIAVFLSLWIISGFRSMVGSDFATYSNYFDYLYYYSFRNSFFEKGYYLLNVGIHFFTENHQYVFLVTSFVTLFLICKTFDQYSKSYMLSIFLFVTMYFYFTSFNVMRQYIAIAIMFYAVRHIVGKDMKKYILFATVAGMFHMTAFLIIPFYWLVRVKYNYYFYLIFTTIALFFSYYPSVLVGILSTIIPKYTLYLNYNVGGSSATSIVLITCLVFILSLVYKSRVLKLDEHGLIYINFVFFSLIFAILSSNNILFFRFSSYFYIYCLLLIPLLVEVIDKRLKPVVIISIVLIMISYNLYLLSTNNSGVLPYQFNFDILRSSS